MSQHAKLNKCTHGTLLLEAIRFHIQFNLQSVHQKESNLRSSGFYRVGTKATAIRILSLNVRCTVLVGKGNIQSAIRFNWKPAFAESTCCDLILSCRHSHPGRSWCFAGHPSSVPGKSTQPGACRVHCSLHPPAPRTPAVASPAQASLFQQYQAKVSEAPNRHFIYGYVSGGSHHLFSSSCACAARWSVLPFMPSYLL